MITKPPFRHFLDRSRTRHYPHWYPKPSDRGKKMTVCVAAICNEGKQIVTASDYKISIQSTSTDIGALKCEAVTTAWWALLAADDISPVVPIVREVRRLLPLRNEGYMLEEIVSAFEASFRKELIATCEREVLAPWNLTLQRFVDEGQQLLGPQFPITASKLSKIKLKCGFLVCGFEPRTSLGAANHAHIVSISGGDDYTDAAIRVSYYDKPGFWAIGSGAYEALSMLFFFGQNVLSGISRSLYHIAAAKFMSESAEGVGPSTLLQILDSEAQEQLVLGPQLLNVARDFWDKEGKPRVSQELVAHIDRVLKDPQFRTYEDR